LSVILCARITKHTSTTAWLPRLAVELIQRDAEAAFPLETGGILMGYWAESDVVITDAIGPGPKAVHYAVGFLPDAEYHEKEVARIYKQSDRTSTYLGDWHTHPYGSTRLSRRDRRTMKRIACSHEARCPKPLMAVLAGGKREWITDVWSLDRAGFLVSLFGRDASPLSVVLY
jgi:integrative and conjugative element protein (TIGR02256 family)